jgi:copper chaperone
VGWCPARAERVPGTVSNAAKIRTLYPQGVCYVRFVSETVTYSVPGMHCAHCERAVSDELAAVPGVERVAVDLETKVVAVTGAALDDAALRAAIDEAGYEAA